MTMLKRSIASGNMPDLAAIPREMQFYHNWCFATKNKIPIHIERGNTQPVPYVGKRQNGEQSEKGATHFLATGKIDDPNTWGPFEKLQYSPFGAYHLTNRPTASDGDFVAAPAFALRPDLGIRCFDIDRMPSLDEWNAKRIASKKRDLITPDQYRQAQAIRQSYINIIVKYLAGRTYVETSMSGNGTHIFVLDKLNVQNYKGPRSEIFAANQFIYMTGWTTSDSLPILLDDQSRVSDLMAELESEGLIRAQEKSFARGADSGIMLEINTGQGQSINCTKEDLRAYIDGNSLAKIWYYTQETPPKPDGTGDTSWSQGTLSLLGHLEKKCPYPEMILEFMQESLRIRESGMTASGEDRGEKFERMFARNLRKVRYSNIANYDPSKAEMAALGQAMLESGIIIGAPPVALAPPISEPEKVGVRETVEAIAKVHKESQLRYSRPCIDVMQKLMPSDFDSRYMTFCQPPGVMGEFSEFCNRAMYEPIPELALLSALTTVAGIAARRYKLLPAYDGPILQIIAVAPSGVGKGQMTSAGRKLFDALLDEDQLYYNRRHFKLADASSQGLSGFFNEQACFCDTNEECHSELRKLIQGASIEGNSSIDGALAAFRLESFDLAKPTTAYHRAKSVSAQQRKEQDVFNVCVSMLWTTTEDKIRNMLNENFISAGFGSRVFFVIYNGGVGKNQRRSDVLQTLPRASKSREHLRKIAEYADITDFAYRPVKKNEETGVIEKIDLNGKPPMNWRDVTTVVGYEPGFEDYFEAWLSQINSVRSFLNDAMRDQRLPGHYTAFMRVAMHVERLAAELAIMDNPDKPQITKTFFQWSLGFVLQKIGVLMTGFDNDELGGGSTDIITAVVKTMKSMIADGKNVREDGGILSSDLKTRLRRHTPFCTMNSNEIAKQMELALALANNDHIIDKRPIQSDGAGRKGAAFYPTQHPIWRE